MTANSEEYAYSFIKLVQRIFKWGNIQNTNLTPDKELNILYVDHRGVTF